jgi:16S rRNA (cytidine1402-2'-O)-methyltransferase
MTGTLYLVATPIGNLSDFSPRARQMLESADFIAAEDTRVTLKLLNHFEIHKPLVSYYEQNRSLAGEKILERLLAGESCALVTDAGLPAISDPGEDMVRLAAENGVPVCPIPGPCASVTALAASGLPTQRFCFEGFLSTANKNRAAHLASLKNEPRTMIFHEAPHKLLRTLQDMLAAFGDREVAVCRELTKVHEEILRTTLSGAIARFTEAPPKGEFVLVVRGAELPAEPEASSEDALALVEEFRAGGMSLKQACKAAAERTGWSKNDLYAAVLKSENEE